MSPRRKRSLAQKIRRELLSPVLGLVFAVAVVLPFWDTSVHDVASQIISNSNNVSAGK